MAKPPKAPEKPASPYMRFSKKIWDSVRSENRDLQLWEVNKILGLMWRQLPDMEKQEFQEEYETEKAEYDKQVSHFVLRTCGFLTLIHLFFLPPD